MSSGTKDQVKGAVQKAKGRVKELAGKLTDNPKLHAKGTADRAVGKAREKLGQVKRVFEK